MVRRGSVVGSRGAQGVRRAGSLVASCVASIQVQHCGEVASGRDMGRWGVQSCDEASGSKEHPMRFLVVSGFPRADERQAPWSRVGGRSGNKRCIGVEGAVQIFGLQSGHSAGPGAGNLARIRVAGLAPCHADRTGGTLHIKDDVFGDITPGGTPLARSAASRSAMRFRYPKSFVQLVPREQLRRTPDGLLRCVVAGSGPEPGETPGWPFVPGDLMVFPRLRYPRTIRFATSERWDKARLLNRAQNSLCQTRPAALAHWACICLQRWCRCAPGDVCMNSTLGEMRAA